MGNFWSEAAHQKRSNLALRNKPVVAPDLIPATLAMKIVALEEHYSTPEIHRAWEQLEPQFQDCSNKMKGNPDLESRLEDFAGSRLQAMDASGVDVQVLSLTAPSVQNLEPEQAVMLAKQANDRAARAVAAHPDRFQAFAALPTPAPDEAARELERAVGDLGCVGAMLNGRTREVNMDDARYFPIYRAAARLGVPLYIHPQCPVEAVRDAYYSGFDEQTDVLFANPGIGWHYETGIQVLRLILSGTFDRLPDLQIIVGHWGEVVLFYLERLDMLTKKSDRLERPISDYFKTNVSVTPSGIYSERYLSWAIEVLGAERILYSTDYPYVYPGDDEPRRFLENAPISAEDKANIGGGNWERLIGRSL